MILTHEKSENDHYISRCTDHEIEINHQVFTQSIIVTPDQILTDWPPRSATELTTNNIKQLIALKPDVLLIGTGLSLEFPIFSLLSEIMKHHVGYEIMTTSAACRTFNLLLTEQRRVIAALMVSL